MRAAHRVRAVANWVNLSTPAGMLLARVAASPPRRARNGLLVSHGYHVPVPPAPAFTLGNVVLLRAPAPRGADPIGSIGVPLLEHEERHATQYALCGGVVMPILYMAAAGWSWLRTGDFASRNVFERRAGLAEGGYVERSARSPVQSLAALRGVVPGPRRR
jgi:hypothetical protein